MIEEYLREHKLYEAGSGPIKVTKKADKSKEKQVLNRQKMGKI